MASLTLPAGPPKACEKCKRGQFEPITWMGREPAYACAGCGRVYEPVPIDLVGALTQAIQAIAGGVSAFRALGEAVSKSASSDILDAARAATALSEEVPLKPRRDPYRRENWRAMERRHVYRKAKR